MQRIFIAEDDKKICFQLCSFLAKYGYDCNACLNFENIIEEIKVNRPDLILLDINLPYFDGYYICREVRRYSNTPIIVVTSRNNELDELMSMNLGADDFITKPYNTDILLAHIESVLRRTSGFEIKQEICHKGVCLDISKSMASYEDKIIELTKNEFRIIQLLMKNSGCIISRNELMDELWQSDEFVDDNTLTVNINRLRKKLEEIGVEDFLITRRGQGYMV